MIEVKQLIKWFGPTLAVDDISFSVPSGQIVGFLGPNGAGKTTTFRILTGYLPPTAGQASVAGFDVHRQGRQLRRQIGYLPENTPLYPEMTVTEFLHFRGRLHRMPRSDRRRRLGELVDRCGLQAIHRRVIGTLSRGNRQRVGLAAALFHNPPVLFLDEPTAGLDPNQVQEVRRLLSELRGRHTIMVSSHILPEVEKTADRAIIIAMGRIVADDTIDSLRRHAAGARRLLIEVQAPAADLRQALAERPFVKRLETRQQDDWCRATVTPRDGEDIREPVAAVLAESHWMVREMRYDSGSLEEFFIRITAEQQHARSA